MLVDSEPIAVRINVAVGAKLGWAISEAQVIEHFIGRSSTSIAEIISARLGEQAAVTWNKEFERLHAQAVNAGLMAVDGIAEALDAIRIPTCVASSGGHEKIRHTLTHTGLYTRFHGRIFSATEVERGKPSPDLFIHAARTIGVAPAACVVVEDSRYGVQAARAAGMRSLGYAGGLTPAEWLEGAETIVFHDMRTLPRLLAELGANTLGAPRS